jgi:hypothetical protein
MAELFVIVRGDPRVWLLTNYDNVFLYLQDAARQTACAAPKHLCRVGEAKHWRDSISFARAWRDGGGELFDSRPLSQRLHG